MPTGKFSVLKIKNASQFAFKYGPVKSVMDAKLTVPTGQSLVGPFHMTAM